MAQSKGGYIRLPGGLHVPASAELPQKPQSKPIFPKLGKKPAAGPIGIKTTKRIKVGSKEIVIHGSTAAKPEQHKLAPEDRKQRRADNKELKKIHSKVRRRKRHGR